MFSVFPLARRNRKSEFPQHKRRAHTQGLSISSSTCTPAYPKNVFLMAKYLRWRLIKKNISKE